MGVDDYLGISELDLAYIAGVIDSDGCIQVTRRNCRGKSNVQYNLEVSISNTSVELIDWLKFMLRGAGYVFSSGEDNRPHRRKICYTLRVSGQVAFELLKVIQPYIRGKKQQVQLALDFIGIKGIRRYRSLKPLHPVLEGMYQEMQELKR